MSVTHPSKAKLKALEERWIGQEQRLRLIARDLRAGRDWTIHLLGLPYAEEIPPHPGETLGRDLRGANLHRYLRPEVEVVVAEEHEAPLVAAISLEGLRNNTPLPDVSIFPVEVEGASEIQLAMRRGDRFLLARCDRDPVGVIRLAERREYRELTADGTYIELSGLAVLYRWRRSGIGTQLLHQAERLATEDGFEYALLRTTWEVGLVPWYERYGYHVRQTRQLTYPDAPTHIDVLMTKHLQARKEGESAGDVRRRVRIVHDRSRGNGDAGRGGASGLGYRGTAW